MNNNNNNYNWADLPTEILSLIGNRLETRIDVYRFRAICRSWRSVVPLSDNITPLSPLLNLPFPRSTTAFLVPVFICRLEHDTLTNSCLIRVTETRSGKMKITNPLCVRNSIDKCSPSFTNKRVNIMNLRFVEVCKGYCFKFMNNSTQGRLVKKVVLFGNFGILMIQVAGELSFFGFKENSWVILGSDGTKYDDIVDHNGQFYVVDSFGTVYWIDGKTMNVVQFSPMLFGFGQAKNLVVSEGELFVVDSYLNGFGERLTGVFEREDMRVYRLDQEWGNWVEVKSLGDRVFVLGKEVCFSVSSKDFPGCDGNCVYFIDSVLEGRHRVTNFTRVVARVFDFEDRRMKTVESFPSHRKLFSVTCASSFSE